MSFQKVVNSQPAPGLVGGFCSNSTHLHSVLAGPGQIVAGAGGVVIGTFAWLDSTMTKASNSGPGTPDGFVGREGNFALITGFLQETGSTIQSGMDMTLYNGGDFWVVNSGTGEVTPRMKAYANNGTGLITFGATGTPPGAVSGSTAAVTAGTGSATGTIVDATMTLTGTVTGAFVVGGLVSGTNVVSGTRIMSQVSGNGTSGTNVYLVSIPGQSVASTTISETHGILTVTVAGTGSFGLGQVVAGGTIAAGTYITSLGTGTGGTGTYFLSNNTTSSSGTVTSTGGIETKWYAASYAAAGELVKMTSVSAG